MFAAIADFGPDSLFHLAAQIDVRRSMADPGFGDGKQTRDYVHGADIVAGLLAAEESDEAGPLNVGTGVETDVLELVERVGCAFGRNDFEPDFAPPREGEVERTALNPEASA